jgi:hypothetical protein
MPMIDDFHSDPDVFIFLISTLAGGTGLNLTGATRYHDVHEQTLIIRFHRSKQSCNFWYAYKNMEPVIKLFSIDGLSRSKLE